MQEIILAAVLLVGMALTAAAVGAEPAEATRLAPGELRVALDPGATPVERRAAALFAAEVERRTGAPLASAAGARYTLVVGTPEAGALPGRPVAASSTNPVCPESERLLTDGVWCQDDPMNFWAHDPAKEKTAHLVVDLGESKAIKEVHIQFRGLYGTFWFVPSKVSFAVSEDGKEYRTVAATEDLPKEGDPYRAEFRKYAVDAKGRYVRLELGPSQHTREPYPGVLELTEIEILGP